MKNGNCLYCYKPLGIKDHGDFHEHCSRRMFGTTKSPFMEYSLADMTELAKRTVELSVTVPGVQPKLSLTLVGSALQNGDRGRLTVTGMLGGNYIFKPPTERFPMMPENEHLTMRIAEEVFGIKTVPSSLVRLRSGELGYITRRIDRLPGGEKIHMIDMCQILEASDKYHGSLERVGKAISKYSQNTLLDQYNFFQLVIFCFLTGNNDMHLKNFSMLNSKNGWGLAPAYDLLNIALLLPSDTEELALTLEGKKRKLKAEHFYTFATGLGLTSRQTRNAISHFFRNREATDWWLDHSFLPQEQVTGYRELMDQRYKVLQSDN